MVIPSCFSLVPVFFSCTPALSLQTWDLPRLAVLESNLTVCLRKLHRLSHERGGELCTDSRRSGAQGCLGLSLLYKRRCQLGARRRRSDRWSCLNCFIRSVRRTVPTTSSRSISRVCNRKSWIPSIICSRIDTLPRLCPPSSRIWLLPNQVTAADNDFRLLVLVMI